MGGRLGGGRASAAIEETVRSPLLEGRQPERCPGRRGEHHDRAERRRLRERSTAEQVNGHLEDEFGGRRIRARGHAKVMTHLMFGIWALSAGQPIRLPH